MPFPVISGLYTGLCLILVVFLSWRVAQVRLASRTGLGTGGSPLLEQRVRAHGNAVEYLPMALLGLVLLELTGHAYWLLHALGATLLAVRIAHAWGLSQSAGRSPGRLAGALGTWVVMVVIAVLLVARFFR